MKLNVQSPTPAPKPPLSARFYDATNPALEYSTIVWTDLFAIPGNSMYAMDAVITNDSNPLMIKVQVPMESFDQTVEAFYGATIYASATVPAGSDMAVLLMELTGATWDRSYQIRTRANGYLSMNLPRESVGWYFRFTKEDVTPPTAYDLIPIETNYNTLAGVDARPFPNRFSVRAKDTTNGTNRAWVYIPGSNAKLQNSVGTQIAGTLTREYDAPSTVYGFRYDLPSTPTTEGTYYYNLNLKDGARPTINTFAASYAFRLDKTPPYPADISPGNGSITNSLPSFSCRAVDPNLADGTAGSGPNMDPGLVQVEPYKELGRGTPISGSTISVPITGLDTTATNHVDAVLAGGTTVALAKVNGTSIERPLRTGTITANGGDTLSVTQTSGAAMVMGETYAVLWAIPCFQSNDGIDRLAAVPIQPAVKGGAYVAYFTLTDKSKNQGTYSSASSIYEAAYGPFSLTPDRTSLYAGLVPAHAANYISGPILTTSGNPVQPGTTVTVFTQPQKGAFGPADANGIPGDGHQVSCDASGILHFQLLASGSSTGVANVKAVLGLANGSDSSVVFVQIPAFTVTVAQPTLIITPGNLNPSTSISAGTFGNAGDLVPNGTMLNATTTLGTFVPADAIATYPGHQLPITGGATAFTFSSANAGTANMAFECGGRIVTTAITVLDQAPPTAPGIPDVSPSLSGTGNFLVTWGAASDPGGNTGISQYGLQYSLNGGAWTWLASVTLPIYNSSGLAHGKYKFRALAVDGAGNVGPVGGESLEVEVDKVPPIGTIIIDGGNARTATTAVVLALTASDLNGVTSMSFSNDSISWGAWIPMAGSANWNMTTGDGPKIVYARFLDSVGNISIAQQDGIILDTTGPSGSILVSPAPYTATLTITLTLNYVDGAGVSWLSLQENSGTPVTMAANNAVAWNLQPTEGTHTMTVSFVDGLGNRSASYSASTILDLTAPSKPTVIDDGVYSPFIDRLHATWNATDTGSGLSHYLVRIGTSAGADNIASTTNMGLATEFTFGPYSLDLAGGTLYYFSVWAVDKGGAVSLVGTSDGVKAGDPSPPTPLPIVTDDGVFTSNSTQLHATWTSSSDPDSGLNRYEFAIGTTAGGSNIVGWTNVGLVTAYTATGLTLTNGTTYYISVRAVNNGNTSTSACAADGIIVDTAAPPIPAMAAEPTYSSGSSNIVSCSVVTDPIASGVQYFFERANDAAFATVLVNSGWTATPSHEFTGLTHGQMYYFRVRSRDAAGNTSGVSGSVNSQQDSNAPTATAFTDNLAGNADPNHTWTIDTVTAYGTVGLADDLSGVANVYIEIASGTDFTSPLHGAWVGASGQLTWTCPTGVDGMRLHARARYEDVAGNVSGWSGTTDGIGIDLNNPVANGTTDTTGNTDPNETISRDGNVRFSFSHSDSFSGVVEVEIQIASDSGFSQIAFQGTLGNVTLYDFTGGANNSTYTAHIRVKDNAGRWSAWGAPSNGIYIDLTPPVPGLNPAFLVNDGDSTTATSNVRLTFHVVDPSGVAEAQVSNDGVNWISGGSPFVNPSLGTGTYHPWTLDISGGAGEKTIYCQFKDGSGVGHMSPVYSQKIRYYPATAVQTGTLVEDKYPVNTYDEYSGQNKYGSDRSTGTNPQTGRSLLLKKP